MEKTKASSKHQDDLPSSFTRLLQQVAFVMTEPSFRTFLTLLAGWVFARRRTITGMIVAADAVGTRHHSAFHRLFAAARWSLDELGMAIFDLIQRWVADGPVLLALDDTLARKRGLKIFGVGMHHDPLISTRKVAVTNWGHSWVVLGVVVRWPFGPDRAYCLPILFRLYVNKKTAAKKRLRYRTRPELAVEMLRLRCNVHENRRFHAIADSACGRNGVYLNLPANCDLTSGGHSQWPARSRRATSRSRSRPRAANERSPVQTRPSVADAATDAEKPVATRHVEHLRAQKSLARDRSHLLSLCDAGSRSPRSGRRAAEQRADHAGVLLDAP